MIENPAERLNTYSVQTEDGGIMIDAIALASDLIAVAKMGGKGLDEAQALIAQLWPTIEVMFHPDETRQ